MREYKKSSMFGQTKSKNRRKINLGIIFFYDLILTQIPLCVKDYHG